MKHTPLLAFISVLFSLHLLVNIYLTGWVLRIFPAGSPTSRIMLGFLAFFTVAFPLGRLMAHPLPSPAAAFLITVGSWYLGFMALALLLALGAHLFLLLGRISPADLAGNPEAARTFWSLTTLVTVTLVAGHLNALHPVVRRVSIPVEMEGPLLTAVLVSDLHVGHMFHNSRVASLMDRINDLSPDIIFLAGDIVDGDISAALEQGMVDELRRLRAPLGIFAVTGNHEYYAGKEPAVKALKAGGLIVLEDEAVIVGDRLVVAGRKDRQADRFGETRLPLEEILRGIPAGLPVVLLDHTPLELEEARDAGIALQLSGHTHHGQMFPFNFVTELIYEEDWGLLRKGETLYYVSCGVGTWGPPVRTSSRPEIMVLKLRPSAGGGADDRPGLE